MGAPGGEVRLGAVCGFRTMNADGTGRMPALRTVFRLG
jgi:hypothetical protein